MDDTNGNRSPTKVDKSVGAKVRTVRLSFGWSQSRLGDALGVTHQQVQKYETGTTRISASRLQQIALTLKVEPSFFFEGPTGHIKQAQDPISYAHFARLLGSANGLALIRAYSSIKDAKQRREVVKFAQKLART